MKFHFLHSLTDMGFLFGANNKRHVTRLTFDAPANPPADDQVLDHFGCWPAAPPASAGDKKEKTIAVDADFDAVILATGVDDLHELLARSGDGSETFFKQVPAWRTMCREVRTVATRRLRCGCAGTSMTLGGLAVGHFHRLEAPSRHGRT